MKRLTYLRTLPATLLCIMNLIFAAFYFVLVFRTVFFLGTYIGTVIRAFQWNDFTIIEKTISETIASFGLTPYIAQLTGGVSIPYTFGLFQMILATILIILFSILYPLLAIMNGTSSLSLRFRGKSSRVIQSIHVIHSVITLLLMLFIIVLTCSLFISDTTRTALASGITGNLVILFLVFLAGMLVILFIQFLIFCYHKDVASHMSFISSDIAGLEDYLDENHLSGLSIFFGLVLLLPVASLVLLLKEAYSLPLVILLTYFALCSFKYFLVAAANRGLKKALKSRARRSRR